MRLGLISDIHSNLHALEAVLKRLELAQPDEIICLGDIVGYGPDPKACLDRLRYRGIESIMGNHDVAVATGERLEDFNPIAREAALWTREQLNSDDLNYLEHLPRRLTRGEITLAHGTPGDTHAYVFELGEAESILRHSPTRIVVCGHTHVPVAYLAREAVIQGELDFVQSRTVILPDDARVFLNPGSVGQPRDRVPLASFAVLDTGAKAFTVDRVHYDVEAVGERILACGLPELLATRLTVGQ
jgi:predicted phosphodiesterase